MKKKLLSLILATALGTALNAQAILNGNFENWTIIPIETVDGADMSQGTSVTFDKTEGNYAAKIENKADENKVEAGVILFGKAGKGGISGGIPYSGSPDSLVGYAKYDIKGGDAGLVMVNFWVNGSSTPVPNIFQITGTSNNFVRFAYALSVGGTVDSIALGLTSGNYAANPVDGGWIIWDDVKFVGTNATQISNTNFESWTSNNYREINDWFTDNARAKKNQHSPYVEQSISSFTGMFAVKTTADIAQNGPNPTDLGMVRNFEFVNNGRKGGFPFSISTDTITFWYKLSGTGNGQFAVELSKNGASVGANTINLPAESDYTFMKLPFICSNAPDTIRLSFSAASLPFNQSQNGNELIIDNIQLMSELTVGISETQNNPAYVYPNPFQNEIFVNFSSDNSLTTTLKIYSIEGKLLQSKSFMSSKGNNQVSVSAAELSPGMYQYTLSNTNITIASGRLAK